MTTSLSQIRQWVVSSLPGNREKLELDPILVNCETQLNKLLKELNAIKHQFINYAEQQVNATESTVTLSKTIHEFYSQANHPGRAESVKSVNAYKQVQENIATSAVKTFHIDLESSGLLTQLNIWVENIGHLKEQIQHGERARIASFQTQSRLQSLQQELNKKKQQPSSLFSSIGNNNNKEQDLDHLRHKILETSNVQKSLQQDFIQVRDEVKQQVNSLMEQRFLHFDAIYVQILECQLKFYDYAQKQSKRFERDIEYYRNQYPLPSNVSVSNSVSVNEDVVHTDFVVVNNADPTFVKHRSNEFSTESYDSGSAENLNNKPPTSIKRVHQKRGSGKIRIKPQVPKTTPMSAIPLPNVPTDDIPAYEKQPTIHQDFIGNISNINESDNKNTDLLDFIDANVMSTVSPNINATASSKNSGSHVHQLSGNFWDEIHSGHANIFDNSTVDTNVNHNISMSALFATVNSVEEQKSDALDLFATMFNQPIDMSDNGNNRMGRKSEGNVKLSVRMKGDGRARPFSVSVGASNMSRSQSAHDSANAKNIRMAFANKEEIVREIERVSLSEAAKARVAAVVKDRLEFLDRLQEAEDAAIHIREMTIEKYGPQLKEWEFDKTVRRNIRTLLCKLPDVLPTHLGWKPLTIAQLLNPGQIKKAYFKAVRIVHPDKAMHRNDSVEILVICERIFQALDCAYKDEF